MRNNPGKTMTTYDLPGIMRDAWPLIAVQKTIHKGIEAAGIFPFNPKVFNQSRGKDGRFQRRIETARKALHQKM